MNTSDPGISDQEFAQFQKLIHRIAGINLSDSKKMLVSGRLQKRLKHHNLSDFSHYHRLLADGANRNELQIVIDLLTTNETYFFRDPIHFDFLRQEILPRARATGHFRVWSAASSSGEEAYSIAMTLAEHLAGSAWEILGSDISAQMLAKAVAARYPRDRSNGIAAQLMSKYCLKDDSDGSFVVAPELRRRVRFQPINLTQPVSPGIGSFDVIFLRNVMIYFDAETKRRVLAHLMPRLKPGGHFIVGHTETLHGMTGELEQVKPTIYRKPA